MPLLVASVNPRVISGISFDIVVSDKPLSRVRIVDMTLAELNVTVAEEVVLDDTLIVPRL